MKRAFLCSLIYTGGGCLASCTMLWHHILFLAEALKMGLVEAALHSCRCEQDVVDMPSAKFMD